MKRVLFLLVSVFMTCTTFASNLSKDVIAKITNKDVVSITKTETNSYSGAAYERTGSGEQSPITSFTQLASLTLLQ